MTLTPEEVQAMLLQHIDSRQSESGIDEVRKGHIIDSIRFMSQPEIRSRIYAIYGICQQGALRDILQRSPQGIENVERIVSVLASFALAVIYESPELEKVVKP